MCFDVFCVVFSSSFLPSKRLGVGWFLFFLVGDAFNVLGGIFAFMYICLGKGLT